MWKLLLFAVAINIIAFTSCSEYPKMKNYRKAPAEMRPETLPGPKGSSSDWSDTASSETTSLETTKWPEDDSYKGQGSAGNRTCRRHIIYDETSDCSSALQRATISVIKFTFKFLNELIVSSQSNTKIGSPLNAWFYMCQAALYSYGNTLQEILKFLGLLNKVEVQCVMNTIHGNAKAAQMKDVNLYYSLNILADYKYNFSDAFKQDMSYFGNGINYDFNNPKLTAKKVNKVVARDTKNKIKNIIKSEEAANIFNSKASVVFIAGLQFQAKFKKGFNENNITMGDFYVDDSNVIQVPYLYKTAKYKYIHSTKLNAKMVEIPFKGDSYTCLLILPNTRCGLTSLVQKISREPELFAKEYKKLKKTWMNLYLPVFDNATSTVDTLKMLKKTGEVKSIFSKKKSQFSDYCNKPLRLSITTSIQKIKIINSLSGEEPDDSNQCAKYKNKMKAVDFVANYPLVLTVMIKGIPLFCAVGKVTP